MLTFNDSGSKILSTMNALKNSKKEKVTSESEEVSQ